jgi:hypothetical protein
MPCFPLVDIEWVLRGWIRWGATGGAGLLDSGDSDWGVGVDGGTIVIGVGCKSSSWYLYSYYTRYYFIDVCFDTTRDSRTTATTERTFSIMNIIVNQMWSRMRDDCFRNMKSCTEQLCYILII